MKSFDVTCTGFSRGFKGIQSVPFSETALIRAAIAAGNNPRSMRSGSKRKRCEMIAATIRSALDMSGNRLRPDAEFMELPSSAKTPMSFLIGNALCAHTALKGLNIPWLYDLEKLPDDVSATFVGGSKRRPDFLGLDDKGKWYIFESKGRTSRPSNTDLEEWKEQTKTVRMINGAAPRHRIVCVSYLDNGKEWKVRWVDPPGDGGEDIEITEHEFFQEYYRGILSTLGAESADAGFGRVAYLPGARTWVGLHKAVLDALGTRNYDAIRAFARQNLDSDTANNHVAVFRDGFVVATDEEFGTDPGKERLPSMPPLGPVFPKVTVSMYREQKTQQKQERQMESM